MPASGVSAARKAWEAVRSDARTRSGPRGLLEGGGRWQKNAHLVAQKRCKNNDAAQPQYASFRGQRGAESMAGSAERCAHALWAAWLAGTWLTWRRRSAPSVPSILFRGSAAHCGRRNVEREGTPPLPPGSSPHTLCFLATVLARSATMEKAIHKIVSRVSWSSRTARGNRVTSGRCAVAGNVSKRA